MERAAARSRLAELLTSAHSFTLISYRQADFGPTVVVVLPPETTTLLCAVTMYAVYSARSMSVLFPNTASAKVNCACAVPECVTVAESIATPMGGGTKDPGNETCPDAVTLSPFPVEPDTNTVSLPPLVPLTFFSGVQNEVVLADAMPLTNPDVAGPTGNVTVSRVQSCAIVPESWNTTTPVSTVTVRVSCSGPIWREPPGKWICFELLDVTVTIEIPFLSMR
jgi:hypothetical protein